MHHMEGVYAVIIWYRVESCRIVAMLYRMISCHTVIIFVSCGIMSQALGLSLCRDELRICMRLTKKHLLVDLHFADHREDALTFC